MGYGLTHAIGRGERDKDVETAVVEGRGREIEPTGPVSRPRFPMLRRIVGDKELPGGVDRVGIEVKR